MENNIFEMLSALMGKQNNSQASFNSQPQTPPMYPHEAYSASNKEDASSNSAFASNGLLSALMSLLGGGNSNNQLSALSKMMSGKDNIGINNFFNNKKNTSQEGKVPDDDIIL